MRRPVLFLAAAVLALAPALADARPGGGSSVGSRGSRTYSAPPSTNTAPNAARPMERSMEPARPSAGQQATRPPIGQPNPAGGFFSRSPFMAGLMGGLIGVGLGGLLFGNGLFSGFTGIGSIFGLLLQIGLIFLLVRLVMGFIRRRQPQPAMAGMPGGMAREAQGGAPDGLIRGGSAGAAPSSAIQVTPADFQAFENALLRVNEAWNRQDEGLMRAVATPEMLRYFGDDLAKLHSRGLRNETRDVKLEQGDLAEAWREGSREFATVAMRFSQIDVTRRISDGTVVEGDPNRRTEATELWTFMRVQGGPWVLSAIQQTG
ncbi:TIM44-like domain-containing protein [Belnapia rosea]|uniref:Predicted lipid-binding transport protein, Tim44 family n=1 Tax=Belnapia rosea TaxID=938405 RepID=A0A1G6UBH1_9PROT|nr:TIM44-like domain-containing protein [Belnapia rosea]SDB07520.1 Predicted lipid-binding transport protein, Tim44 family [Belnapia rosea]SDD38046.1 Predicted lipid-binding transport protein, Tim44 family [Belnapia rosea]